MKAIVLNHVPAKINYTSESIALRIGYLFCDKAISAGPSYHQILAEHYYSVMSMEDKIDAIEKFYQKHEDERKDWNSEDVKATLKLMNKIKHHSSEGIARKKLFEKRFNTFFNTIKEENLDKYRVHGLPQLQKLCLDDDLELIPVEIQSPETQDAGYTALSTIVQLKLNDARVNPDFFCLPNEFFIPDFFSRWKIAASSGDRKAERGDGFMEHCFTLPNINRLSAIELETVRKQLAPSLKPFKEKVNQWMLSLINEDTMEHPARFFKDEILPLTAEVLHVIAENEILNHTSELQNNLVQLRVIYGALPVKIIWEFYRAAGVIKDESWAILEKALETDEFKNKFWPIMTFVTEELDEPTIEKNEEEREVKSVKKSISID